MNPHVNNSPILQTYDFYLEIFSHVCMGMTLRKHPQLLFPNIQTQKNYMETNWKSFEIKRVIKKNLSSAIVRTSRNLMSRIVFGSPKSIML